MYITAQGPFSEMTYTVSSGTLNSSIPYHTLCGRRSAAERLTPPSTPQRSSSFPRWPLQLPYA